jgi:hypothetical protein
MCVCGCMCVHASVSTMCRHVVQTESNILWRQRANMQSDILIYFHFRTPGYNPTVCICVLRISGAASQSMSPFCEEVYWCTVELSMPEGAKSCKAVLWLFIVVNFIAPFVSTGNNTTPDRLDWVIDKILKHRSSHHTHTHTRITHVESVNLCFMFGSTPVGFIVSFQTRRLFLQSGKVAVLWPHHILS